MGDTQLLTRISILLAAATATLSPVSAHAQSLLGLVGDLLRERGSSTYMKSTCLELAPPAAFLAHATGDNPIISDATQPPNIDQRLSRQVMASATIALTFVRWTGTPYQGDCHVKIDLHLPPAVAAHLNGVGVLRYAATATLDKRGDRWHLDAISIEDIPVGDALNRARRAAVDDHRKQQNAAAEARDVLRRAEADAARREFARTHPAEFAEQQRQSRQRARLLLDTVERAQQARAERYQACIARGGVWWQPTGRTGSALGAPQCR